MSTGGLVSAATTAEGTAGGSSGDPIAPSRRPDLRDVASWAVLAAAIVAIVAVHVQHFDAPTRGLDIHHVWRATTELASGVNPYQRVLAGDPSVNQKYFVYFPLFLVLGAASQLAGLHAQSDWLAFWRVIFALFDVGIACVLFASLRARGELLLAAFAALFWGLNRWTLFVVQITNYDVLPIFFLVLSVALLRSRTTLALLLLGVSLSLKQVAVFLVPLYLVWLYRNAPEQGSGEVAAAEDGLRRALVGLCVILVLPVLLSAPFLLWHAEGYVRTIGISVTRAATSHWGAPSVDAVLGVSGLTAKLPMLSLMLIATLLVLRGRIGMGTGGLLVLSTFVDFNSVFFVHYPAWVVPFLPLAAAECMEQTPSSCAAQRRSR